MAAAMVFEGHPALKWEPEEVIKNLCDSAPDMREPCTEGKDGIRNFLKERLEGKGLTGQKLLGIIAETCDGPQDELEKRIQQAINSIFGEKGSAELTRLMAASTTNARKPLAMIQALFQKVVLMGTEFTFEGAAEKRLFSVIQREWRRPAYDCFYPAGDTWVIQSGDVVPRKMNDDLTVQLGSYCAPSGWLRLALHIDYGATRKVEEWNTWHKAYHGTSGRNLESIIQNGLLPPQVVDGKIQHKHGIAGCGGTPTIYCSPSIEYAAHYVYTTCSSVLGNPDQDGPPKDVQTAGGAPLDFQGLNNCVKEGNGAYSQFVFEVRVRPNSFKIQGNTLHESLWPSRKLLFDPDCSSANLEWLIQKPEDIICTGVMIRTLLDHPTQYNQSRIQAMKDHVGWSDEEKKALRPRNHGGPGKARWEWNAEKTGGSVLSMDPDLAWKPYDSQTSNAIEAAYQEYMRYCFIGRPSGAEGPAYYIDFGDLCGTGLSHGVPRQARADGDKENAWRQRAVRRVAA